MTATGRRGVNYCTAHCWHTAARPRHSTTIWSACHVTAPAQQSTRREPKCHMCKGVGGARGERMSWFSISYTTHAGADTNTNTNSRVCTWLFISHVWWWLPHMHTRMHAHMGILQTMMPLLGIINRGLITFCFSILVTLSHYLIELMCTLNLNASL